MDAYEAIIAKRDRRDYLDKPIPDDVLRRILQAGRMAGSSSNSQPFRFVVLGDPKSEVRQKIGAAGAGTAPLVKAPLSIVVVLKRGSRDFDAGRTAQNMMVAAWAEGIGMQWSTHPITQDPWTFERLGIGRASCRERV